MTKKISTEEEDREQRNAVHRQLCQYVMNHCAGKKLKIKFSAEAAALVLRHDMVTYYYVNYLDNNHVDWYQRGEFWKEEFHRWLGRVEQPMPAVSQKRGYKKK